MKNRTTTSLKLDPELWKEINECIQKNKKENAG